MDLFDVKTIVKEYGGHRDVRFSWFREDRKTPLVPYAEGIQEYDPNDQCAGYSEMALRELFSREEAEALVAYLDGAHGDEGVNQIKKRELPLSSRLMPLSGIPTGGGPDHYELWRKPEYNLPFKVVGFFDLRGYERIDGNENIAEYSGQMIFMSNGELILVGKEMERLLSEGYTSEQARAKIQMWRCSLS